MAFGLEYSRVEGMNLGKPHRRLAGLPSDLKLLNSGWNSGLLFSLFSFFNKRNKNG